MMHLRPQDQAFLSLTTLLPKNLNQRMPRKKKKCKKKQVILHLYQQMVLSTITKQKATKFLLRP